MVKPQPAGTLGTNLRPQAQSRYLGPMETLMMATSLAEYGAAGKLWKSRGGAQEGAAPSSSSLDRGLQKCTLSLAEESRSRRRKGRGYQRIMSGLRLGGELRLLTLTTSEESWLAGKDIQRSFRALVMRLRRRRWCSGYVKVKEFTRAGLPHLHVIIRGPWIPQSILGRWWQVIHLSPIVDVRAVRRKSGAAAYLAKYLGKDPRSRYSWSWDWVWRGFAGDWHNLCVDGLAQGASMLDIIAMWEVVLDLFRESRLEEA